MKPFLVEKLETQDFNEMVLIVSILYHVFCNVSCIHASRVCALSHGDIGTVI